MQESEPDWMGGSVAAQLAAATWVEADVALAKVYQDIERLETALAAAERARSAARIKALVRAASNEALALRQSASYAVHLRGFSPFAHIGELVTFDQAKHRCLRGALRDGDLAQISSAGLERRVGEKVQVVSRAIVRPIRKPV